MWAIRFFGGILVVGFSAGILRAQPHDATAAGPDQPASKPPPVVAPDLSSPRDTMQYYLETMKRVWDHGRVGDTINLPAIRDASQAFDLSQVPGSIQDSVGIESSLLLKEILDRMDLVDLQALPGDTELTKTPTLKTWRMNKAPVIFTFIDQGPNSGAWQVSSQTVERLPNFYEQIQGLPYLKGSDQGAGWDQYTRANVFPPWMMMERMGLRFWQWAGIFLGIFLELILGILFYKLARTLLRKFHREHRKNGVAQRLEHLLFPATLLVVAISSHFYVEGLRLLGTPLNVAQVIVFGTGMIGFIWLLGIGLSMLADALAAYTEPGPHSMDMQLVRLLFRGITVAVVVTMIIVGANYLGLPAYSVVTGLGVGGLAMALGAKDTLSNFIGSIMIMLDKPFRVGHWIRVGTAEGIVEDVGFRSTRIRTFDNSLVSIPNQTMTSQNIDNYGLRQVEHILTTIALPYGTASEKLEAFLDGVRKIMADDDKVVETRSTATITDFNAKGYAIQLNVYIKVGSRLEEASERERLLLSILKYAESMELAFVPPG